MGEEVEEGRGRVSKTAEESRERERKGEVEKERLRTAEENAKR